MFFKEISFPSLGRRSIIFAIGVVLMYFGIACYYQCGLGTDPYSVMVDGMHSLFSLTHGEITNVLNVIFFILMLIFGRKYLNIGTIINYIVAGMLIDAFEKLLSFSFSQSVILVKILMLITGVAAFSVGTGMYVTADLGVGGSDFVTLFICERTGFNLRWVRIVFDLSCLLTGIVLGAIAQRRIFGDLVGVGTIIGAFGTGIIMKWTINVIGEPLRKWFGPLKTHI